MSLDPKSSANISISPRLCPALRQQKGLGTPPVTQLGQTAGLSLPFYHGIFFQEPNSRADIWQLVPSPKMLVCFMSSIPTTRTGTVWVVAAARA